MRSQGGEIVGFAGGFFGVGDAYHIDFDWYWPIAGRSKAAAYEQNMSETYTIHRAPLPSPLALLAMGLLLVAFTRIAPRMLPVTSGRRCVSM